MNKHEEIDRFAGSGDIFEGGWVLYKREDGTHFMEATDGPDQDSGHDEPPPWAKYTVYRVELPEDVYAEHNWVGEADPERLSAGKDPDPEVRAMEIETVAETHGWVEFDSYPLELSYRQLRERWDDEDMDEESRDAGLAAAQGSQYGVPEPQGLLYELVAASEKEGWDLDASLLAARRLWQKARDPNHEGTKPEGAVATFSLELLNKTPGAHDVSAVLWGEMKIVIEGPDHSRVVIGSKDKSTWEILNQTGRF